MNCTWSVTDCVGFRVIGKFWATREKPVPVMAVEFIVTGAVPVDVNVTDCVTDVFTVTLPKLKLAGLSVNCGLGAAALVPFRATVAVLPVDESLSMVSWPLADPVVVGLNCTWRVNDWVGFRVTGRFPPTSEKPVPVMAAEFIVTGAVPVDVNVTDCVTDVFTVTLPKLRLAALSVNNGLGAGMLVPLSATAAVLPVEESLSMES